ncbi:MAG: 2-oxo acid dehydrogenase subunit E2 [Castellaniella sp.]|uniref:dihydrolipoamide acetyltransferase family protein n=1 Tax=Castellaniella sp. TaxID=1955812 RepID=UPI0012050DD0|nr:dihydrolipoamide acetyltransferase family protein [Castellaniella sp.]TAN27836.1 MAG: 2-oxo acid dehydrogenase subunit E2 [Castellaniella sp.]
MGIHIIKMPDIGEGIAEVELAEWHVQVGDAVVEDQVLADVMTDKATVQVPSPVQGRVVALGGKAGDVMAVGTELIRLEVEGAGNEDTVAAASASRAGMPARAASPVESPSATPASAPAPEGPAHTATPVQMQAAPADEESSSADVVPVTPRSGHVQHSASHTPARTEGQRPLASPAVRRRAWDLGVTLQYVPGTGPAGRVTHGDLDAWLARDRNETSHRTTASLYDAHNEETQVPVIGLRRKIAQKMQESKRHIPHFTYVEETDVTELESLRARLNARYGLERGKLTLLPFLVRALVLALRDFPQINARFDDDAGVVTRYGAVHLGIAAQTPSGLMVPVVHHAETLDLWSCAAEISRLAEATRQGKAARDELTGSTITITSLGPLGGIVSTPVINWPEVAIIGINRVVERPVFQGTQIVARKLMNLSSSFDHRVVDGMDAAEFVQCIRRYLECPALLFVE